MTSGYLVVRPRCNLCGHWWMIKDGETVRARMRCQPIHARCPNCNTPDNFSAVTGWHSEINPYESYSVGDKLPGDTVTYRGSSEKK